LEEKIKMEQEAREAEYAGISTKDPSAPRAPGLDSKKVAVKIAEKAGPRKCYNYFEFERSHLRRSS
jgi:hypothetical protein